jgi:CheY-like chemotaxis protein
MRQHTAIVRILVAEHDKRLRGVIRLILKTRPEYVISEAYDGLEATQKATELEPDLILLDISLPSLDGFEAARRIRCLAPAMPIVFLTSIDDADLATAALNEGKGYLLKTHLESELLPAIGVALRGGTFVSYLSNLGDYLPS